MIPENEGKAEFAVLKPMIQGKCFAKYCIKIIFDIVLKSIFKIYLSRSWGLSLVYRENLI